MRDNQENRWSFLRAAFIPATLCLALNLAIFATVALNRPDYLRDYRVNTNPDAVHYVVLGRNVLLHGHYSRCDGPPFVPDMLRPPVYPLFAGGLDLLAGAGAIYLAQALLQAGSCLLLFALVHPYFGQRAALWASLLLATDLMLAVYNFEAMSEPLFVFLVLAAVYHSLPSLAGLAAGVRAGTPQLALGGLLLGLAILTRPAALYLPVVLGGCLLAVGWRSKRPAAGLAAALVFLVGALPLPALWITRNYLVFSVPRLTTVDAANNVYFMGGGAYQLRHGLSLEEAQARIAREYGLAPYEVSQNPWASDRPVAEVDAELRTASFRVMTKYPVELVESSFLGVAKASFSHNTAELAALSGRTWTAPGTAGLIRLRPDALDQLGKNGSGLVVAFGWELFHVLLSLGAAALGVLYFLIRRPTGAVGWALFLILGYFYLTVAVFGYEAFYRCRVPVLPFLYVFAGLGLNRSLTGLGRLLAGWWVTKGREAQLVTP
jgi:4-amino-4-deoxy-L-arabinose transferase-like glycosyltransferase